MIVKQVQTSCDHCGLTVPQGLLNPEREQQFCCYGCLAAWDLIHDNGLDGYYKMLASTGGRTNAKSSDIPLPACPEFDEPSFHDKFVTVQANGMAKVVLAVGGIHCAACVWLIEKLPSIATGVVEARVNWSRGTVAIQWEPSQIGLSKIAAALHQLGYPPLPVRNDTVSAHRSLENRRQLIRIGMAAAAAGNNMLIAAALYFGMFSFMSAGMEGLFRIASCVVGVFSVLGPGSVFLRGAFNSIRTKTPHMDLPIALGLSVGTVAGLVNAIRGTGEIYFDSLSVLVCLLLVGRWIQFRQQNRAADAVELLYRLTPQRARKRVGGELVEVAVEDLQAGDQIEIRPGDLIAADGVVIEGTSNVDEAILTGESRAAEKQVSGNVYAGTKNLTSPLLVAVEQVGNHTRINKIVELVEQASLNKPKIVQWANQIGGYFVAIVLVLAAGTLITWLTIDPSVAVDRAVALLIVACPCALAMATPLAVAVALGRLARRSVLVKSGDVLQSLDQSGIVWLDKTGTLTTGKMQCVRWYGDRSWIRNVAALEENFNHPIAQALTELGDDTGGAGSEGIVNDATQLDGGVAATIDGRRILVGNRNLQESHDVQTREWQAIEDEILSATQTPCWISVDQNVVALASVGDSIRPDAAAVLDELNRLGWEVGILSGDHPDVVHSVARQLQIKHVRAAQTPEQKLQIIRQSNDLYPATVMVGDGVNDSAALAAATVGIAVCKGADASLAAAPVCLGQPGLDSIRDLLASSRSTMRTIKVNFIASLGYNVLGVGLAMAGWLNPLVAAILMPISSLTVISLSIQAAGRTND